MLYEHAGEKLHLRRDLKRRDSGQTAVVLLHSRVQQPHCMKDGIGEGQPGEKSGKLRVGKRHERAGAFGDSLDPERGILNRNGGLSDRAHGGDGEVLQNFPVSGVQIDRAFGDDVGSLGDDIAVEPA